MTAHDDHLAAAAREHAAVREERDELRAEVRRLNHELDALHEQNEMLRVPAIRAGLEIEAKRCLEMIAKYREEGDCLDSARVIIALNRALEAMADARRAA